MAQITLKGNPIHTSGELPALGTPAPAFRLTGRDLADFGAEQHAGKRIVLNVFPSLDTPVCAASVRRFNTEAAGLADTVVVCASADLPFAAGRFCTAEGIEGVLTGSAFRCPDFGKAYGLEIVDGPLQGLLARAVVVLDRDGKVLHRELVPEIAQEPDYAAALAVLK